MIKNTLNIFDLKNKIFEENLKSIDKKEIISAFLKKDVLRNWKIDKVSFSILSSPFLGNKFNCKVKVLDEATNISHEGNAEGNNKYNTIYKGFSEAYERYILHNNNLKSETSNGYASHYNLREACVNSFYELLERDVILYNWYRKNPPLHIIDPYPFPGKIKYLKRYGYKANFYRFSLHLKEDLGLNVILCLIKTNNKRSFVKKLLFPNHFQGRFCGFGCSLDLSAAIWKAYREASLNAWAIFLDNKLVNKKYKIEEKNKFHSKFYYEPMNTKAFEFIEKVGSTYSYKFSLETKIKNELEHISNFIEINNLDFKWILLSERSYDNPFYVVKAQCPQLQELWFGHRYDKLNPLRFHEIKKIEGTQVYPHPIA